MGGVVSTIEEGERNENASLTRSVHSKTGKSQQCSQKSAASLDSDSLRLAISLVMPIYYTKAPLSFEEKEAALKSWKSITGNRATYFLTMKEEKLSKGEEFPYNICSDYFSQLFYDRLFLVHPNCKGLFANSKMKMRMNFMSVITLLLDAMENDPAKFTSALQNMTRVHNIIGVKAVEYGLGCECLMYSIQKTIGPEEWTSLVAFAWAKIFSRILDEIIPGVIKFEMEKPESSERILEKRKMSQFGSLNVKSFNFSSDNSHQTHSPSLVFTSLL